MYICLDLHTYIHYMNMNICVPTRLTRDDFDIVTENGRHLGPKNEFNREQFQVDAWVVCVILSFLSV